MLDRLRENPSAVVAALVAAGILAIAVGAGGNSGGDSASTDQNEPEETVEVIDGTDDNNMTDELMAVDPEASLEVDQEEAIEDLVAVEPQEGPVVVSKEESTLRATVRPGDNQTLIVRQMVDDFATQSGQSISAEQRLYVETNVVNSVGRNDIITTNDTIEVDESVIADFVSSSRDLTPDQIALWAMYL